MRRCGILLASIILGALTALPAQTSLALQPCRPPPPVRKIWPSWNTKAIPKNGVLFLQVNVMRRDLKRAWLKAGNGQTVTLTLSPVGGQSVYLARPTRLLTAGRSYALWVKASPYRLNRYLSGRPATAPARDYRVPGQAFRVGSNPAPALVPRIGRPRVKFGRWGRANNHMSRLRAAGRKGHLEFRTGPKSPVVVTVEGSYSQRPGSQFKALRVFGKVVYLASTGRYRCPGGSQPMPPAPRGGRYTLKLTPHSITGKVGPSLTVSGRVR